MANKRRQIQLRLALKGKKALVSHSTQLLPVWGAELYSVIALCSSALVVGRILVG